MNSWIMDGIVKPDLGLYPHTLLFIQICMFAVVRLVMITVLLAETNHFFYTIWNGFGL